MAVVLRRRWLLARRCDGLVDEDDESMRCERAMDGVPFIVRGVAGFRNGRFRGEARESDSATIVCNFLFGIGNNLFPSNTIDGRKQLPK